MKTKLRLLILFFFLLSFSPFINSVQAVEGDGIGLFPAHPDPKIPYSQAWLIYNLVPGESKKDAFVIVNKGDKDVRVKLYSVDATTTKDGSFALKSESAKKLGVGSWLKLSTNMITVPAGGKKIVPFIFQVPTQAEVGDHMGGIVAEKMNQPKNKGALQIKTRIGLRVYETVPGQLVRRLSVSRFEAKYIPKSKKFPEGLRLVFNLKNEGNVHLNPVAEVELINNLNGHLVAKKEVILGTIFPKGTTRVPVMWTKIPLFGSFVVKAKVNYSKDDKSKTIVKETRVTYFSQKAKFIFGSAVVLLFITGAFIIVGKEKK